MKRQRNTAQRKEQTRSIEIQINEEEIGKLPEKEFRIMIVKMIKKNLENKMEKMQESVNKDLEELQNRHTVTKDAAAAAKSLQSLSTVQPHRRQPTRLPRPWDSPGKDTGVGFHFLLQCMEMKRESEVTQSCWCIDIYNCYVFLLD